MLGVTGRALFMTAKRCYNRRCRNRWRKERVTGSSQVDTIVQDPVRFADNTRLESIGAEDEGKLDVTQRMGRSERKKSRTAAFSKLHRHSIKDLPEEHNI